MEFCNNCGTLVTPTLGRKTSDCIKCGKRLKIKQTIVKEKIIKKPKIKIRRKKDISIDTLPKTTIECPKCRHMEASWWIQQTASALGAQGDSDLPETQFFKCTACEYTWREDM